MKLAGTKDIAMIMKIAIITSVPPSLKNKRYNDTCKLDTQRTYEFFIVGLSNIVQRMSIKMIMSGATTSEDTNFCIHG